MVPIVSVPLDGDDHVLKGAKWDNSLGDSAVAVDESYCTNSCSNTSTSSRLKWSNKCVV